MADSETAPRSREADVKGSGPLANPGQITAEKRALRLVQSPEVAALRPKLRAMLEGDPAAQIPDGAKLIDRGIDLWSMDLALCEAIGDTQRPQFIWRADNSAHAWFGHEIPGTGVAGDNPDHIPRTSFIDGNSRYVIKGKYSANPPAQLSFEIFPGTPGSYDLKPQSSKSPDLGAQISVLKDTAMQVEPDGSFTIAVGQENVHGNPNFLKTNPGPMTVIVRDILSDWSQIPADLQISLIDAEPSAPAPTDEELLKRYVADLPGYVGFWSSFKNNWLGGLADNTIVGPVPREGGWGYLGAGRFNLGKDDALIFTTSRGGGSYTGVQITDPWMIMPRDSRQGTLSLNNTQAAANPDGTTTYALSPEDPGLANWVDTGGLQQGFFLLRWAGMPANVDAGALLLNLQVVKLADIPNRVAADVPRLDATARAAQVARRTADYNLRLGI